MTTAMTFLLGFLVGGDEQIFGWWADFPLIHAQSENPGEDCFKKGLYHLCSY